MESPPPSSDLDEAFDASRPLQGVVVCCTSVPAEQRTDLANKVSELGGVHKYDLTPEVTHLIVGEYDTPKYRHVAKQRPDIQPMALGWVDAVRALWVRDDAIDLHALEKSWRLNTFETGGGAMQESGHKGPTTKLLCCLSGFEDDLRQDAIAKIKGHGAEYTGNLDRSVTHLIVREPSGKKYLAAKKWDIQIVSIEWIRDSIARGMILEERYYDPHLPPTDIGQGAWTTREMHRSSRKRQREAAAKVEDGKRKLRKTASMKLNSQRENMWGEILGQQQPSADRSASYQTEEPTQPLPSDSALRKMKAPVERASDTLCSFGGPANRGDSIFASCYFYISGFTDSETKIIVNFVVPRGGTVATSLQDMASPEGMPYRFALIPQASDPQTHPLVPDGVELITECYIEKCIHKKILLNPRDHVIGRPFRGFPIPGFNELSLCSAGFTDVDLLHVDKVVRQLGAAFQEHFNAQCSMLLCASLDTVRKQKLDIAVMYGIPVVKADWLWECIAQAKKLPIDGFTFPGIRAGTATDKSLSHKSLNRSKSMSEMAKKLAPKSLARRIEKAGRKSLPGPDMSAFDTTPLVATEPPAPIARDDEPSKHSLDRVDESVAFETAPTHQSGERKASEQLASRPASQPASQSGSRALSEKSANDMNKTAPKEQAPSQPRQPLTRIRSEVCDSEAGEDDGFSLADDDAAIPVDKKEVQDGAESEYRRIKREKAKKAEKAAAERQALSNKLTSLLEGTSTKVGINSSDGTTPGAGPPDNGRAAAPRRKRDIMGRAISNVSAASSGSQESSERGLMRRTHSVVLQDDESQDDDTAHGPTDTQIQYDDPDATKSRALLMSKVLGRSSPEASMQYPGANAVTTMGAVRLKQEASAARTGGRSMRRR